MSDNPDRRRMLQLSLAAIPGLLTMGKVNSALAEHFAPPPASGTGPEHDFDFFIGSWNVKHRRLKKRLAGNNEWEEFDGTTNCVSLLGGIANMNDSVSYRSGASYRGLGLRAFDAKTNRWADWTLSASDPLTIDAPGVGRFVNGIGTFLSDDTFDAKPIMVRGIFSSLSATVAQWEQAYSPDAGKTWETNWVMRYTRTT
ncbi:MAG: DUF1579 domain-containing protein [bacterium]